MNTQRAAVEILREKCVEHGLKLTPQRIAIYEAICHTTDHPSADKIFKKIKGKFPSMSFDTVNRTLLTFSAIGLLKVVEGHGDPKRFDPNLKQHHHFRCIRCNTIIDVYSRYYDSVKIPQDIQSRFTVLGKRVVLEGICKQCRKKS